jgi:hypothetical protein
VSVGEGERTTIEDASERRSEQLRRLAGAALLIDSTVEIDELLSVITEQARETIGAHQAAASLTTRDNTDGRSQPSPCRRSTPTSAGTTQPRTAAGSTPSSVARTGRFG